MKVQRTIIGINSKPCQRVLVLLICFVELALCFTVANGLQQRRIISESISSSLSSSLPSSSIRGGPPHRNLRFGALIVCNICPNSTITSSETFIPGQSTTCSTLDSMGQNKTFRSSKCNDLQTDNEIASLCCGKMTTTVTPTTSPSSSSSKNPPVASPTKTNTKLTSPPTTTTTTTIISTSESKQGISTGATVSIIIVVIILVSAIGYYFKFVANNNFERNDHNESVTHGNSDKEDNATTMGFPSFRTRFRQQKQQQENKNNEAEPKEEQQQQQHHHRDDDNDNDDMDIDIDIDNDIDNDDESYIKNLATVITNTGISSSTDCALDIEQPTGVVEKTIILPLGALGLVLETGEQVRQPIIDEISNDSPLKGTVTVGDIIISINGTNTRSMNSQEVGKLLKNTSTITERTMIVLSSNNALQRRK